MCASALVALAVDVSGPLHDRLSHCNKSRNIEESPAKIAGYQQNLYLASLFTLLLVSVPVLLSALPTPHIHKCRELVVLQRSV